MMAQTVVSKQGMESLEEIQRIGEQRRAVAKLLAVFSYKPGWKFELIPDELRCMVKISFASWDADFPCLDRPEQRKSVLIQKDLCFPYRCSEKDMIHYLVQAIEGAELHEAREWMRFNGAAFRNPHKEKP